jgi:methionine-rich copper-binding protein CopC
MKRIVLVVAAAASMAFVTAAFAHAEPATVTPGNNAVLATRPTQVTIEMSQDMARQAGANDIVVADATGKQVTTAVATIDDSDRKKLSVPLPNDLAVGVYTVNWKTLSADDGDAANGTFQFTYDPAKPPAAGTVTLSDTNVGTPATAAAKPPALDASGGSDNGTSWVLFAAVAVGMLVIGAGGTFLLVNRRP